MWCLYPNPPGPGAKDEEAEIPRRVHTSTRLTTDEYKLQHKQRRWEWLPEMVMVLRLLVSYPNPPGPGARGEEDPKSGKTNY